VDEQDHFLPDDEGSEAGFDEALEVERRGLVGGRGAAEAREVLDVVDALRVDDGGANPELIVGAERGRREG